MAPAPPATPGRRPRGRRVSAPGFLARRTGIREAALHCRLPVCRASIPFSLTLTLSSGPGEIQRVVPPCRLPGPSPGTNRGSLTLAFSSSPAFSGCGYGSSSGYGFSALVSPSLARPLVGFLFPPGCGCGSPRGSFPGSSALVSAMGSGPSSGETTLPFGPTGARHCRSSVCRAPVPAPLSGPLAASVHCYCWPGSRVSVPCSLTRHAKRPASG